MAKISAETIENLREFMDRECDYAGTQEVVNDLVYETLRELLFDGDDQFISIEEFANLFWDKTVECILNVLETE